jgi:hypothetical protein
MGDARRDVGVGAVVGGFHLGKLECRERELTDAFRENVACKKDGI